MQNAWRLKICLSRYARRMHLNRFVLLLLLCSGCHEPSLATGPVGPSGVAGATSLLRIIDEPAGAHCANGGHAVQSGLDKNGNGILDDNEVTATAYLCTAQSGPNGESSLVRVIEERPGANCRSGGHVVQSGLDANGNGILDAGEVSSSTYLCDPRASTLWSQIGNVGARYQHGAAALPGGRVLVTGGSDEHGVILADTRVWDPNIDAWTIVGSLSVPVEFTTLTAFGNGALIAGGYDGKNPVATAAWFDVSAGHWSPIANLKTARYSAQSAVFKGDVVVIGGSQSYGILDSAERYDGTNWLSAGTLNTGRYAHAAVTLADGQHILVVGGYNRAGVALASAELYDGVAWVQVAPMAQPRAQHTATLLPDGRVLVIGGRNGIPLYSSAELYDPVSDRWSDAGSMLVPRAGHAAVALNDPKGRVLVAGGNSLGGITGSAEWWQDGVFTDATAMSSPRVYLTLTLSSPSPMTAVRAVAVGGASGNGVFDDRAETLSLSQNGQGCGADRDCLSDVCAAGICCASACGDGFSCASGVCPSSCFDDSRCDGGHYCLATACVPRKVNGSSCTQADECTTGLCTSAGCG